MKENDEEKFDEVEFVELSENEENEVEGGASVSKTKYITYYCQFTTNNMVSLNFSRDGIQMITNVSVNPKTLYWEKVGPTGINFKLISNDRKWMKRQDLYLKAYGNNICVTYKLYCVGIGDGTGRAHT